LIQLTGLISLVPPIYNFWQSIKLWLVISLDFSKLILILSNFTYFFGILMSHYRFMAEPEANSETNNHSNKTHFLNHPFFSSTKWIVEKGLLYHYKYTMCVWRHFRASPVHFSKFNKRIERLYLSGTCRFG